MVLDSQAKRWELSKARPGTLPPLARFQRRPAQGDHQNPRLAQGNPRPPQRSVRAPGLEPGWRTTLRLQSKCDVPGFGPRRGPTSKEEFASSWLQGPEAETLQRYNMDRDHVFSAFNAMRRDAKARYSHSEQKRAACITSSSIKPGPRKLGRSSHKSTAPPWPLLTRLSTTPRLPNYPP